MNKYLNNKTLKINSEIDTQMGRAEYRANNYDKSYHIFKDMFEANPLAWWLAMEAIRSIRAHLSSKSNIDLNNANDNDFLLLFSPDYSKANTYQKNLYSSEQQMGFQTVPLKFLDISLDFAEAVKLHQVVLHQHWLKEIYFKASTEELGLHLINRYVSLLKAYKAFGARVVWSLHNLMDHDATSLQESLCLYANKEMAKVSDRIYIHSKKAAKDLSDQCEFDISYKCFFLEHPLYDQFLTLPDHDLPAELSLIKLNEMDHPDRRILLHVGMIRPYKGISDLLCAFDVYTSRNPVHGMILVIAGQIFDQDVSTFLADLSVASRQKIFMISRRVSDSEIAALMKIADLCITPYRKVLTSGSFYLSTTFRKPTLAPAIGMFPEVIQHGHSGYLYDGTIKGLTIALENIASMPRKALTEMGDRVFEAHEHLSVSNVSQRFFHSLESFYGMKTIAFDALWQEPARTEKHAFDLIRQAAPKMQGAVYLAFPWATLIDATERKTPEAQKLEWELDRLLTKHVIRRDPIVISVCQHIKYRKYLPIFRRAGVTDLYCSHAEIGSHIEHGIRIWPFQLFPTQCPDPLKGSIDNNDSRIQEFLTRDIDFSYVGAFDPRYYMTNIRQVIVDKLSNIPASYIKERGEWHYEKQVYTQQVYGKHLDQDEIKGQSQRELEYREIMSRTKFALCPSGTGPNSIRFWEALEFGCIPILLSDKMELPGDEAEWLVGILRVPEDHQAIERIPALIKSVLADQTGLSARLAALRLLRDKFGVRNMVQHLFETTRAQAAALCKLASDIKKPTVFVDGRRLPALAFEQIIEGVKARLRYAGVEARVIAWDHKGIAFDEKGVEICRACEPLSLVDTSRPFGLIFNLCNLTEKIVRGLTQLLVQPVYVSEVSAQYDPAQGAVFDVTLISSVFKGRRFLPAFLESISNYTSKPNTEHLMIVAASPEDEWSLITQLQSEGSANISLIYLPTDPGLYEVWNLGLSFASGPYVGNANLDDFRAPRQIELLVDLLEKMPDADVASAAIAVATEPTGDWSKVKDLPVWYANIKNGSYEGKDLFRIDETGKVVAHNIPHCVPLWRRCLHEFHGYFNEQQFGPSADWEFWLRCGAAGVRFAHLNEVLGIYYKNQSTYWRRNPDTKLLEQNIIKCHFENSELRCHLSH